MKRHKPKRKKWIELSLEERQALEVDALISNPLIHDIAQGLVKTETFTPGQAHIFIAHVVNRVAQREHERSQPA